jgi:hypothetical protein
MPQFRCLVDLFLPAPECRYAEAGSLLSDVMPTPPGYVRIPVGWIPPLGVEPLDQSAMDAFFNAGPSSMVACDHGVPNTMMSGQRWSGIAVAAPSVYWKLTAKGWTLGDGRFRPG